MPLERRLSDVDWDGVQKADQYRLGVVAYEMLVGSKRFRELGEDLRQDAVPDSWQWPALTGERKDCPHQICNIIERMVKTNPRDRYDSIDDVVTPMGDADLNVERVRDSYRRLMASQDTQTEFFQCFYVEFLKRKAGALGFFDTRKFESLTEDCRASEAWQRQFQMLKEAVLLLIVFKIFREEGRELNILTRIGEEHAKRGIPAGLYSDFAEVLVDVVLQKDRHAPLKGEALRRAWTSVIQPGIDYMKRKTEEIETRRLDHATYPGAALPGAARRLKAERSDAEMAKVEDLALAGITRRKVSPAIPGESRRVQAQPGCPYDGTASCYRGSSRA